MKALRYVFSAGLFFCCFFLFIPKGYAAYQVERIGGIDRYETAIEISRKGWKDEGAENVVLVTGDGYADALSAAPFAGQLDAPILLTPKTELDQRVAKEIKRLGAKNVYIIGGREVVSQGVENMLKDLEINILRIKGDSRYETSVEIAKRIEGGNKIIVTTGDDFTDALSISPIAVKLKIPIILVPKRTLPQCIRDYIANKSIEVTYVIGSDEIIADNVAEEFPNIQRICGDEKYMRNIQLIKFFKEEINLETVYISTGEKFPDALAGSILASKSLSPIVLTSETPVKATDEFIKSNLASIKNVKVFGGEDVVSIFTLLGLMPKEKEIIDVPLMSQMKSLPTGCEATAAAMLINWAGVKVKKEEVASILPRGDRPYKIGGKYYGSNPNSVFVGSPFSSKGYGVFHKPIADVIDYYLPGRALDITGISFEGLLDVIDSDRPVVLWVTIFMKEPKVALKWYDEQGEEVVWKIPEHAMTMVGYNSKYAILADPYTGTKKNYPLSLLKTIWEIMGSQAVTLAMEE